MNLFTVTFITDRWRMDRGENGTDLMSDGGVTVCAFDFMVGDMCLVHELRGVFCIQEGGVIVALETFSLRDMAIPLHHIHVALLASHPSRNILPMIETPAFDFNIPFRLDVTRGAASHRTGEAIILSSRSGAVVMTDETVGIMDCEVEPLNNLGVARCTSNPHSPPHLAQMSSVGKTHILIDHVPLQIFGPVTSSLQAVPIVDLIMELLGPFPNQDVGQCQLEIDPFPFDMICQTGLTVTVEAGYFVMGGRLPRFDILLHVVAKATKRRAF
jgi:hypothetical protein